MRWQRKVVLVALGATSAFAAMMLIARAPSRLATTEPAAPVAVEEPKQVAVTAPAAEPAQSLLAETDSQAREFADRERFHVRVRTFFAEAPALSRSEKVERAQGLAEDISRYEAAGELSASEALVLKIALIRETVPDQAAQTAQVVALHKHYRVESERLQAEWQARPDPAFELYKAREREIVAEVSSMSEIPDGMSRNEYLRQRLQRAREDASAATN
jgi:hypothetical protein